MNGDASREVKKKISLMHALTQRTTQQTSHRSSKSKANSPGELESAHGGREERVAIGLGAARTGWHDQSLVLGPDLHTVGKRVTVEAEVISQGNRQRYIQRQKHTEFLNERTNTNTPTHAYL